MVITATDVSVSAGGDIRWEVSGDVGIVIAFNEDTDTYTNETSDAQEATANDILLPPFQTTILGDYTAFGHTEKFSWINVDYSTAANTDGTMVWQYYDGTTWSTLTVVDNTNFFEAAATTDTVTFTPPDDWAVITIDSVEGFFIRLYCSTAPTTITTAGLGDQVWQNVGAGSGPYTVLEVHRFLQDKADDQAPTNDDLVAIYSTDPSARSTDNIITLNAPYNIDDSFAQRLYDGSITQASGDDVYSGLVVVGSLYGTTTLQVMQVNALYNGDAPFWGTGINPDATANIITRMLIKTRYGGTDRDGKKIRVFAREWGETYAEFSVTMGLGNSVAAIFTNNDLNNTTAVGTVATWTTITNVEGYQLIDIDNGEGTQPYYSQWNRDSYTINQLYERAKWLTRRGTTSTVYSMDGELFRGITHQFTWGTEVTGGLVEDEEVSWGSGATAGIGELIAYVDDGSTGTGWIQLLTGAAPTDAITITGASGTVDTVTVTGRTLSPVFLGVSTGSALIGAYGVGIEALDLGTADRVFDLGNNQRIPPNNVTFYVYGVVSTEDYILITPEDGSGGLDYDALSLSVTLDSSGQVAIVVTAGIPADTPSAGTVRVQLDDGRYRRVAYTSWDTSTFTTASTDWTDPDDATSGNNVFVTFFDELADATTESFQTKYDAPRTLFIRVRDGGVGKGDTPIKSFESTSILGTGGGSSTVSRTPDV